MIVVCCVVVCGEESSRVEWCCVELCCVVRRGVEWSCVELCCVVLCGVVWRGVVCEGRSGTHGKRVVCEVRVALVNLTDLGDVVTIVSSRSPE